MIEGDEHQPIEATISQYTPPKFNIAPEKVVVGRPLSYWDGKFSGASC